MDIVSWFQLATICLLGAVSPGPSLALVASNTIVRGRAYGVVTSLAHGAGIGLWAVLTAVGVVEVIVDKSGILLVLQSLGAFLIAYIGFRTLMDGGSNLLHEKETGSTDSNPLLRAASEGLLISLLNPKIALFFLAIFSHLVNSDANRTEIILMGGTAAVVDALWYVAVALVLTGSNIGRLLGDRSKVISRVSGSFLILIAVYLLGEMIRGLL
jgi:threonine/homoserine/homoserine lactone efflux protein|tara:strand:+ start:72 stop:710 length:639 start_codon:yes stop_codon:yes gene_type:complete